MPFKKIKICTKKNIRLLLIVIIILTTTEIFSQNCDTVTTESLMNLYENVVLNHQNNYTNATNLLNQIIKLDSTFLKPYFLLAEINYNKIKEEELLLTSKKTSTYKETAIVNLNQMIAKCPEYKNYSSYYLLGDIYFLDKNYEKSIENFSEFLKYNIGNTEYKLDANTKSDIINNYYFLIANPVEFNPEPLQRICSEADEFLPLISPNGEYFFFTRRYKDETNQVVPNDYLEEFTFSTRITSIDSCDELYTTGEPMPAPFNDGRLQGGATITIDNSLMFITICENERTSFTSYRNCDLFYSNQKAGEWKPLKRLGKEINTSLSFEGQPSITTNGEIVYFASNRDGGYGGYDIYKIEKNEIGEWLEPVNLGPVINTIYDEKTPFIHADNHSLYYASTGHGGIGGFDIFVSYLTDNSQWSEPQNLGYPINTEDDEVAFIISTDGTKIYFSLLSSDSEQGWDIYSAELPKDVRPSKVLLLTGDITNETGRAVKNATVEITNTQTLESTEGLVDDKTGKYAVSTVVDDDDTFILSVNSEGTFFDTYFIDPFDEIYDPPTELDIQLHTIEKELPVELRTVNFETNSYELNDASLICIKKLIKFLEINSELIIEIRGHTDNVGNDTDNLLLSKKRAKAVRDYIVDNGIEKKRVTYEGYGENVPVSTNSTDTGRSENRRVEFIVVE